MKLKTRSKEKESKFIVKLQELFSDPDNVVSLVPECIDSSMLCPFDSYRKKLSRMPVSSMGRLAGGADQFLSAIGETYKVMESESAPITGIIPTPYGNVDYAKRGNTDPMVLGGIQNYDNLTWRMLSFSSLVKTRKVSVFSSRNYYLGSCKGSFPGPDFLKDVFSEEKVEDLVSEEPFTFGRNGEFLKLEIASNTDIIVYQDSKTNVMRILLRHMLVPDITKLFKVSVPYLEEITQEIPPQVFQNYFSGTSDAKSFIQGVHNHRKNVALSRGLYLISGEVFKEATSFLTALFDEHESGLLEKYVEEYGPISIDTKSQRKVLELLWPKFGKEILRDFFPEMDEATLKAQAGDPVRQIELIRKRMEQEEASSVITVSPWSPESSMLVEMVKDYFSIGKAETIRKWERRVGYSSLFNSMYYALIIAIEGGTTQKWRFSAEQMLLGDKMAPAFREIFSAEGSKINDKILELKAFVR